jgi:hypothetical protein
VSNRVTRCVAGDTTHGTATGSRVKKMAARFEIEAARPSRAVSCRL